MSKATVRTEAELLKRVTRNGAKVTGKLIKLKTQPGIKMLGYLDALEKYFGYLVLRWGRG